MDSFEGMFRNDSLHDGAFFFKVIIMLLTYSALPLLSVQVNSNYRNYRPLPDLIFLNDEVT